MKFVACIVGAMRPKKVVEFGSGFSTLVLGTLVRDYGGQVLSFEHSPRFTRAPEFLRRNGLSEVGRVNHRRITFRRYGLKVLPMYSTQRQDFDGFSPCELGLIDGPPGDIGREAVLYELFPRLAVGGWVIVDDVNRVEDRRWVESWKRVFGDGLQVDILPEVGRGVAVLRKLGERRASYAFGLAELYESWRHAANAFELVRKYK